MKSDAEIWLVAADMIAQHGSEAENEAIRLANLMFDARDHTRQGEWLRVLTAIGLLRTEPATSAATASGSGA
jgi:hypothetical protein